MESQIHWINERQVHEITGRALSSLRNDRCKGVGLPYYRWGRSVRYRLDEVLRFMEDRKVKTNDN